jgi:hypothetical protein
LVSREEIQVANSSTDLWTYRTGTWTGADLTGYDVEALDGGIGSIAEASNDVGAGYLVVDTGPWIFGKKVMVPAGMIDRVDAQEEKVWINLTKDQIKNAPEFDEDGYREATYRGRLDDYYATGGTGQRRWEEPLN